MKVAVIGLGRFGYSLVEFLVKNGNEIIAIDKDEKLVQHVEGKVSEPIVGDATDETLLRRIAPKDLDAVVVAIGDDVEASVLACITLIELGAKYVIAKAEDDKHAKILRKIGVHKIVQPERDSAKVIADHLMHPKIFERFVIGENHSIIEIKSPKSFWGKTLKALDLRNRYNVLVIGIKRREPVFNRAGEIVGYEENVIAPPPPNEEILEHDVLIVLTSNENLMEVERWT